MHEEFGTNSVTLASVPNAAVEDAMRRADKVIKFRIYNQRLAAVPMEPRGTVAKWEAGYKQLTVWSSTQIPHLLRSQ
ncbi:MAG: molybdopterin cofactor-binding domain-containing protein, partial [Candidatus Binataceae bacterium]